MGTRPVFVLFILSVALFACSEAAQATPRLPESVSPPGWKLTSFDRSAALSYMPYPSSRQPSAQVAGGSSDCWRANYAGPGTALIRLCRYNTTNGAFDGWQRARADEQTVKFQEGKYLVLVTSNDTPPAKLTFLMRALQTALSKQ
jgi:hypothetical protein